MNSKYKGIMVFIEIRQNEMQNVSLELLGKARRMADQMGVEVLALPIGKDCSNLSSILIEYGADKVIEASSPELELYMTEPYTQVVNQAVNEFMPEIVLFGATSIGRDLAPRVSARTSTGLTADCTSLEIDDDGKLLMTRPAFGGNLMATIICPDHRPQMSTVRPGVMTKIEREPNRKGEIIKMDINLEKNNCYVEILEYKNSEVKKKDIQDAKILVSGGRGVGNKENFNKLEELAKSLGAQVSSSRASVDIGWTPSDIQVGQTGKTVRPEVYFACGISGAIQHVAGMEESELIIAINKDKSAKIFEIADLGLVGDLHKVLPLVVDEINKIQAAKKSF